MKKIAIGMCIFLLTLFTGILFGVQYMHEEQGISHSEPLSFEKDDELSAEKEARQKDLREKSERVKQIGYFNFFSDLGEWLGERINEGSRVVLVKVTSFIHHLFTGG